MDGLRDESRASGTQRMAERDGAAVRIHAVHVRLELPLPREYDWREHRGEGEFRLINFTSIAGLFGAPGQPNYAAAKLGIVGLTLSCARALNGYGVTSNAVAPAAATRMAGTIPDERLAELGIDLDADLSADAVAYPVAYLASPESSWLNGRVLGCHGKRICLYSNPAIEREVVTAQPWDVESVFREMPSAFNPATPSIAAM